MPVRARLTLRGVAMNANPTIALISVDGGPARSYAVGQQVAVDAVIDAIQPDRVLLRRGDSLETLRLLAAKPSPQAAELAADESGNALPDPDDSDSDIDADTDDLLRDVSVVSNDTGGFLVQNVTADSIYDRLGVRVGDLVYSLDPLRIIKLQELARLNDADGPKDVRLEVVRGNRRVLLTYQFDSARPSQ